MINEWYGMGLEGWWCSRKNANLAVVQKHDWQWWENEQTQSYVALIRHNIEAYRLKFEVDLLWRPAHVQKYAQGGVA